MHFTKVATYLLNGHIERATIEPLYPTKGVNGTLLRLHLEYNTDFRELPSTMIAKLPSPNAISAERLRLNGGARAEVGFYQKVHQSVGLRVQECFFSVIDETTGLFSGLLLGLYDDRQRLVYTEQLQQVMSENNDSQKQRRAEDRIGQR